jgi:hypothetical protein
MRSAEPTLPDCIAQMNAETDGERPQALGFELTIERFARRLGEKGALIAHWHSA